MIGRLNSVVFEARDPYALARFYSELLGYPITRVDGDPPDCWVDISEPGGRQLSFQHAPDHEPPVWPDSASPMQIHLDIDVDDIEAAEAAVLSMGASRLPWDSDHEVEQGLRDPDRLSRFRVYADPDGHPFCLVWENLVD